MALVRARTWWDSLTSTLWFLPALMTGASIGLAAGVVALDRTEGVDARWFFLYSGGPEGARSVLSTTAGSMITVAGVAFSATMVALSFASSQLGPRLLRNFMKDRGNQVVLGTFIATFVYCLLVLRTVSETGETFVPHFGVTIGLVLALASLVVLIYFIHHVARTLQADYIIGVVASELDRAIEHMYPSGMGEAAPQERIPEMREREHELRSQQPAEVCLTASDYVHALDVDLLMKLATKHDLVIRILSRPGRYAHDGIPVAEVWPAARADDAIQKKVRSAFMIGRIRTSQQDVEFAINQLVEVATRALSPGINDPFTAITCIDRLTTALLHLMRREFPPRFRVDAGGSLRVIADRPDFAGVTDAAFHQIRQSGANMPAVAIRLLESLSLLLEHAATDQHRRALEHHLQLVRRAGLRQSAERSDREDMEARVEDARTTAP
ncbi:MAG TPA: DUF2254 domain-containing protein [Thermoanaerobaculia bacterium]